MDLCFIVFCCARFCCSCCCCSGTSPISIWCVPLSATTRGWGRSDPTANLFRSHGSKFLLQFIGIPIARPNLEILVNCPQDEIQMSLRSSFCFPSFVPPPFFSRKTVCRNSYMQKITNLPQAHSLFSTPVRPCERRCLV